MTQCVRQHKVVKGGKLQKSESSPLSTKADYAGADSLACAADDDYLPCTTTSTLTTYMGKQRS